MAAGVTREQTLSGTVLPEHLTGNPDFAIGEDVETDAEQGLFACQDCHRRITRNSSNYKEYGHDTDCEHHEFASVTEESR